MSSSSILLQKKLKNNLRGIICLLLCMFNVFPTRESSFVIEHFKDFKLCQAPAFCYSRNLKITYVGLFAFNSACLMCFLPRKVHSKAGKYKITRVWITRIFKVLHVRNLRKNSLHFYNFQSGDPTMSQVVFFGIFRIRFILFSTDRNLKGYKKLPCVFAKVGKYKYTRYILK